MSRERAEPWLLSVSPERHACGCRGCLRVWQIGSGPRLAFVASEVVYECTGCGVTWTAGDLMGPGARLYAVAGIERATDQWSMKVIQLTEGVTPSPTEAA